MPEPAGDPSDAGPTAPLPAPSGSLAESLLTAPVEEGGAAALLQRARLAEDRLAELMAGYRALRTETEAHKERITRNVERRFELRHQKLLLRFIDILDNIDRALEAAEQAGASLIEGLILVRTQLLQTLQAEGLERIPVLGLPFDPHTSEGVATEPVREPDHDHLVIRELMRGYRIGGQVARPARVVVGRYEPPAPSPDQAAEPAAGAEPGEPPEPGGSEESASVEPDVKPEDPDLLPE